MTTKEQERKALEQIRKIVAGLGEDSYIATAFEGCFEDAERNIDDDAAYSMKGRWEMISKNWDARLKEFHKAEQTIEELKAKLEEETLKAASLSEDIVKVRGKAMEEICKERKDITIETTDGTRECMPFAKVEYFNNDGFRFINVVEKSGWTTSYKLEDLKVLRIE